MQDTRRQLCQLANLIFMSILLSVLLRLRRQPWNVSVSVVSELVVDYHSVCGNFADHLYKNCKHAELLTYDGQCVKVADGWKNGKDLIENVFNEMYAADNENCFNTASSLWAGVSLLVVFGCLLLL